MSARERNRKGANISNIIFQEELEFEIHSHWDLCFFAFAFVLTYGNRSIISHINYLQHISKRSFSRRNPPKVYSSLQDFILLFYIQKINRKPVVFYFGDFIYDLLKARRFKLLVGLLHIEDQYRIPFFSTIYRIYFSKCLPSIENI